MIVLNNLTLITELQYRYKQVNFIQWINDFASINNLPILNNTINYNILKGEGIAKAYNLQAGISALVHNCVLQQSIFFKNIPTVKKGILISYHANEATGRTNKESIHQRTFSSLFSIQLCTAKQAKDKIFAKHDANKAIEFFIEAESINKYDGFKTIHDYLATHEFAKLMPSSDQISKLNHIIDAHQKEAQLDIDSTIEQDLMLVLNNIIDQFINNCIASVN
jgi:hypothetical protein